MGGDALVQVDELVGLFTGEPSVAGERVEPPPGRQVLGHIRVEIHEAGVCLGEGCRSFTRRSIRHALGSMAMYGSGVPADGTIGVGADDLVSGEAVALDLPPANIGLRVLSGLIDIVAGMSLWFALRYIGTALAGDTDDAMLIATLTVATILAIVAFPTAIETATRGKTLGHLALGLRTVRDDAGPISFRHALTRALVGSVELYSCMGFPALVASV